MQFGALLLRSFTLAVVCFAAVMGTSTRHVAQAAEPPGEQTPKQDARVKTIVRSAVQADADRADKRWEQREERLRAKPIDWRSIKRSAVPQPSTAGRTETPGATLGSSPDPRADEFARRAFPTEWRRRQGSLEYKPWKGNVRLAGTADIATQYCSNCSPVPDRAIGKLFFDDGSYCSASVIGTNTIATAAHCCWDGSKWYSDWSFAPGYENGNTPYGVWNWTSAAILTSYANNFSHQDDVCVINLKPKKIFTFNLPVSFFVGSLGRSWDQPSVQVHHALGYPNNIGSGQTLQLCTSESFSPNSSCGGTNILNTGCSMTYGSSGGPWIRFYRGVNQVNSVVSGYDGASCTGTFGQTFNGPRFTSSNIGALCSVMGC